MRPEQDAIPGAAQLLREMDEAVKEATEPVMRARMIGDEIAVEACGPGPPDQEPHTRMRCMDGLSGSGAYVAMALAPDAAQPEDALLLERFQIGKGMVPEERRPHGEIVHMHRVAPLGF